MYKTSDAYNVQIRKDIRDFSYMHIQFRVTDPDADTDAEVSNNGQVPWSVNPSVLDDKEVSTRYATLELNRWCLNGRSKILPDNAPYDHQAFVGDKISEADGLLQNETILTIRFDAGPYAFSGLTFIFDRAGSDHPAALTIQGTLEGTLVYEKDFLVDAVEWVIAEPVPGPEKHVDTLVFTFKSTALPYRRVRIEGIILGLRKMFTDDGIVSSEWKRTSDLMNTVLPNESMNFTFYDPEKEYNPDNPEGIWEYVESGQQIKFEYGYQLEDGTVEWVPGSTYYLDGSPTVENGSVLSKITFSTTSKLQALTDIYDEGTYSKDGVSLYELADRLLRWAGVLDGRGQPLYVLDESLKNYSTSTPLPVLSVRELLQIIANAGMCVLYTDRDGKIVFTQRNNGEIVFKYTFADVKEKAPTVEKYPYLKNLVVSVKSLSPSGIEEEIASVDVVDAISTEYVIEYDAATDLAVSVSDGLVIDRMEGLFAYRTKLVLSGTGTVTVKGIPLDESAYIARKTCNPVGVDCTLENQFICSQAHAVVYLEWMSEVLTKRNVYSFDDRGFPETDIADPVSIDTAFTTAKEAHVTAVTIRYNGALSGKSEVLS